MLCVTHAYQIKTWVRRTSSFVRVSHTEVARGDRHVCKWLALVLHLVFAHAELRDQCRKSTFVQLYGIFGSTSRYSG